MATNVTTDLKGRTLTTVFPAYRGDGSIGGPEVLEVTVDTSLTAGLNVTGDTMVVAAIPKNSFVSHVQVLFDNTQTPTPDVLEGATSTFNLGDSGSATRYSAGGAINGNANSNALVYPLAAQAGVPQFYSAADTLILTWASGTLKKARFRIRVVLTALGTV